MIYDLQFRVVVLYMAKYVATMREEETSSEKYRAFGESHRRRKSAWQTSLRRASARSKAAEIRRADIASTPSLASLQANDSGTGRLRHIEDRDGDEEEG